MAASDPANPRIVLALSCPDRMGIVATVSRFLFENGCDILDSAQFGDRDLCRFFLRIAVDSTQGIGCATLSGAFRPIADQFDMDYGFFDAGRKMRSLIMVSRFGHCLHDLMYRTATDALPIEIALVVSNHRDLEEAVTGAGIPFHHLPVTKDTKPEQEQALHELITANDVELTILARYMQVLSADFCKRHEGRLINIHHSFLPSFKGARPYHQAHARGVKLIGATAHYVTNDLDDGPIIEQAVERVHHGMTAADFVAAGRDIESHVLARAVKWHAEHRVLLNGVRTVVFT